MKKNQRRLATVMSAIGAGLLAMTLLVMPAKDVAQASQTDSMGNHYLKDNVLKVKMSEIGKTKRLDIKQGKAVIIDLPVPVRDVLVSDPTTVDAVVHKSTRIYLIGVKAAETNVFFFNADGQKILSLDIEVKFGGDGKKFGGFGELESTLQNLLPGSSITIKRVGYTIILNGSVKSPIHAANASTIVKGFFQEYGALIWSTQFGRSGGKSGAKGGASSSFKEKNLKIINMLSVEAREQVMLKVQVVEMNREIIKQLGVNIGAVATAGSTTFSMLSNTPFSALGKEVINGGFLPGGGGYSPNGFGLANSTKNFSISQTIKAMERNGLTRLLAEPNLTAISGETASFHAGGEFPIPVATDDNTVSVEWKKFGVLVNFTPIVLSEGRISLQIKSEVSEISQEGAIDIGGITLPAISKRNVESTVELPSGGSMMMAGLISQKTRQAMNGLPGLKNLPVLGALFRSRDYVRQETELVILVTPYVVKPVANRKLTTPDVGYAEASDAKANLLGHFNRVYGRRGRMPSGRQQGDYGFIVE